MKTRALEDFVGNTPLVRLQPLPGKTSNTILAKLEGNNPAGSVKDRPALSMIKHAEARGEIKPGDTLIEATRGNPDTPLAHYEGTGPEIWRDTEGGITHFVSSMGTTGTIMGTSRLLKEKNPKIELVGVQAAPGSR